ncbi:MAG: TRAP transporter permease [Clostridia bacterium]|nr:TRAP transporter permease [Clostridia bacterium]
MIALGIILIVAGLTSYLAGYTQNTSPMYIQMYKKKPPMVSGDILIYAGIAAAVIGVLLIALNVFLKIRRKKNGSVSAAAESEADSVDDIMKKYDKESNTRIWTGGAKIVINALMIVFSLYCIWMTLRSTAQPEAKLAMFLGCITIVGYLNYPFSKKNVIANKMPVYDIILMAAGAFCFFYFAFNSYDIVVNIGTKLESVHVILGVVGILVLVELCRRCVGIPILFIAGALFAYTFYNEYSYAVQYGKGIYDVLKKIIQTLFYTTNGIIGTPTNVCYTYIVLFIIFGAFLERTGIANYFISFANRIAGKSSGGPAKVAVISSALCGMVSGSSVGNTVTTGSVTIPMMKKTGYKSEFAAAVEAAASTGGQIMPPIMGAAAFLMAEYMKIPYAKVAVMAIFPAVLYFTGIFIAVHLEAKKLGLKGIPKEELPKWGFLAKNFYLIIPLAVLIWLVSTGTKTMASSAAISILVAFVVGGINTVASSLKQRVTGQSVGKALTGGIKQTGFQAADALVAGARGSVTVAVACAMAGIIAGCITVTGLASTLINAIVQIAGDYTIVGLFLTMICCIILGMGVPTTANYCIMASTCAPILIKLGFPTVASHFFVFYFGIVADITPPVALAAFAGSAIAKSNPMKTGFNATKLAIAAFVVPYIFAYSPQMLLTGAGAWYDVVLIVISAMLGLFSLAAALNGFLFKKIPVLLRVILIAGGLCMMIPGWITDIAGLAVLSAVIGFQFLSNKKSAAAV